MKKSLLGVVLCVALLLTAVSAMLAMPASAAEANLLDGNYAISEEGDGSATASLDNGVLTITNTVAGEIGVNCGENGASLETTPNLVLSVESDVPFNVWFNDSGVKGGYFLAAEFAWAFEGASTTEIPAGTYDVEIDMTGPYKWNPETGALDLPVPEGLAINSFYICPKAAGTMTITKLAFVGEGDDTTTTTESTTETTESTTETTESTTEATKATTTVPADAYIVYTIETVEHEGNVVAGEEIAVNITSSEAANIGGMGLIIAYDPAVLEVVGTEEAGWFAASGMSDINVMESEIRFNSMDLAGANSAADEVIATLTFKALVDITDEVVLDATSADVVSSADVGAVLTAWATDGAIVVVEPTTTESTTTTTESTEADVTTTTEADTTTTEADVTTTASATTTKANESPKTGDAGNALLLVVIAAAAAVVLTVSVKKVKA